MRDLFNQDMDEIVINKPIRLIELFGDAVETIKVYVAELPLKDRLKLAKNIVFKEKFEF